MTISKSVRDALAYLGWHQAMLDELSALNSSGTWELVPLMSGKSVVGCRCLFAIKDDLDGIIGHLKAPLMSRVIHKILGVLYILFDIILSLVSCYYSLSCIWGLAHVSFTINTLPYL